MASQPTFDLHVPGRAYSSAMDWFADHGFDTWTMDNEGYGRSDKHRDINCDISNGADDLAAGTDYVLKQTRREAACTMYGISSGALKAALFAQRHPERVAKLAMERSCGPAKAAPRWSSAARSCRNSWPATGGQSTALSSTASSRATIRAPRTKRTINAFADAILTLDDSMPTGTYVDMCSKLPLIDPSEGPRPVDHSAWRTRWHRGPR